MLDQMLQTYKQEISNAHATWKESEEIEIRIALESILKLITSHVEKKGPHISCKYSVLKIFEEQVLSALRSFGLEVEILKRNGDFQDIQITGRVDDIL